MAKPVYQEREISLQDGTEVVLRPLPIARLKRFMAAWKAIADVPADDDGLDIFVNCCGISLEHNFRDKFDELKASGDEKEAGEVLSEKYKDYLSDVLDLETMNVILEVCGGINLSDPKLLEAAQESM